MSRHYFGHARDPHAATHRHCAADVMTIARRRPRTDRCLECAPILSSYPYLAGGKIRDLYAIDDEHMLPSRATAFLRTTTS